MKLLNEVLNCPQKEWCQEKFNKSLESFLKKKHTNNSIVVLYRAKFDTSRTLW